MGRANKDAWKDRLAGQSHHSLFKTRTSFYSQQQRRQQLNPYLRNLNFIANK